MLSVLLAVVVCLGAFASCELGEASSETGSNGAGATTEAGGQNGSNSETGSSSTNNNSGTAKRFNYFNTDLTPYINVDSIGYGSISVSISKDYLVDDKAVDAYIQSLCASYATVTGKITDREIVNGDTVYLYYEGVMDGVAFEGGSNMNDVNPTELVIGSGRFIPGFEEALIGIIPAETSRDKTVALNLTFPEDYHSTDLAGKSVVFNVYVAYIAEYSPAEYNEDFVKNKLGFATEEPDVLAAFEKYIYEYLEAMRDDMIRNAIWEVLLNRVEIIKYPEGEYEYYYDSYIEQIDYNYNLYVQNKSYYSQYYGMNFDSKDEFAVYYFSLDEGEDWKVYLDEESKTCVKQNLIYHSVSQAEEMKITSAEYQAAIEYYVDFYSSNYGYTYTEEQIEANLGADHLKQYVIFEKVSDLLFANASVSYVD